LCGAGDTSGCRIPAIASHHCKEGRRRLGGKNLPFLLVCWDVLNSSRAGAGVGSDAALHPLTPPWVMGQQHPRVEEGVGTPVSGGAAFVPLSSHGFCVLLPEAHSRSGLKTAALIWPFSTRGL